jgi:long-chain acyl-CoA synthetase
MNPQTLNDIFFGIVERKHDPVMLVRETSGWAPVSSQQLYRDVAGMARTLSKWGLLKGDRLAILSENRFEWAVTDFAPQEEIEVTARRMGNRCPPFS